MGALIFGEQTGSGNNVVPCRGAFLGAAMTAIASTDLIAELDHVLKAGPSDRRVRMLRQVVGLFLEDAHRLNEHHIGVFDDVLVRLMEGVELRTLTTLSRAFADSR